MVTFEVFLSEKSHSRLREYARAKTITVESAIGYVLQKWADGNYVSRQTISSHAMNEISRIDKRLEGNTDLVKAEYLHGRRDAWQEQGVIYGDQSIV